MKRVTAVAPEKPSWVIFGLAGKSGTIRRAGEAVLGQLLVGG